MKKNNKKEEFEKNLIAAEEKTRKLAERYNVTYVDLSSYVFNRELVQSFPVDFLYRSDFIPLEEDENIMKIAVADPSNISIIDSIESFCGKKITVFAASQLGIHEALRKSETALQVL